MSFAKNYYFLSIAVLLLFIMMVLKVNADENCEKNMEIVEKMFASIKKEVRD